MTEYQVARAGNYDDIPIYALADGTRGNFDNNYYHPQNTPSLVWTIEHNLGKYPAALAMDTGGRRLWGNEEYPDTDVMIIRFSTPQAGSASVS